MKRLSEKQAVNAQAKAFIQTLPDCRCEEKDQELLRLREALLIFLREYTADEYMGIDIHELACSYTDTEIAEVKDDDYIKAFIEIMKRTEALQSKEEAKFGGWYICDKCHKKVTNGEECKNCKSEED